MAMLRDNRTYRHPRIPQSARAACPTPLLGRSYESYYRKPVSQSRPVWAVRQGGRLG